MDVCRLLWFCVSKERQQQLCGSFDSGHLVCWPPMVFSSGAAHAGGGSNGGGNGGGRRASTLTLVL